MSRQKPRSGNTPLVLPEIEIPNGGPTHFPITPDTTGINIGAARLTYPHDGLKLRIEPWPNMNRGDSYKIKLDAIPSVVGSIDTDEQVGKFVERFIGADYLPDGSYNLSYDVTRVGNPVPEASLLTPIFVKVENAPPGGQDLDAGTPGHSELHLSIPPEFLPPGGVVDKDAAAAGVPVTIEPYPIMVEGDRIKLSWGGEFVWRTVEGFEVGTPIVITVEEDIILAAGDTDTSGLAVAFILYDVVDNESRGWSAEVRVVVDTGSSRLPAPFIAEMVNLVLDMDQLGDADLTFQVVPTSDFALNDQIEMHLSGTTASGERVEHTYEPEEITNPSGITQFKRPSAEVRPLAGGVHAAFYYHLIKADGSADLLSKSRSPRVIGRSTLLAAPIAYDEIAGTLDPDLPNTRVDIPWDDGMVAGNVIMLVWEGTTANGNPYVPDLPLHPITANEQGKTIEISVDGEHLKSIEGGTLELYYWLLSDEISRAAIRHESLHAGPLNIGPLVAELPAPEVEGESGGVLDPDDVPFTGTRLTVRQYSGQIEKDVVHILWWGSITGRYRDQITLNSVTDKIDVPFTIRKALVEDNLDGTVQAMYWVKRANGHVSPSDILLMSIGAAMDLPAPSITSVHDSEGEVVDNGTTYDTTVTLSGTAAPNQRVEIFDVDTSKGSTSTNGGDWELQVAGLALGSHSFTAKGLYGSQPVSPARILRVAERTIEDFESVPLQLIVAGKIITTPLIRLSYTDAGDNYGYVPEIVNAPVNYPHVRGHVLHTARTATLEYYRTFQIALTRPCSSLRFWHVGVNVHPAFGDTTAVFRNSNGAVLGSLILKSSSQGMEQSEAFSAPDIALIEMSTKDLYSIDYIELFY
ncbi:Ig-like domain repeat protein [Pseudomonas gingeri]|uniref:Ig-like domain repeat protein n=1 Tax=Pseudomonas gingeri TaxID=117681 RepID=UPI0015A4893D|nr:Ig-like domain repeat protein [Pseudomonas gingeri]NWA25726.1 Ig-like domain repeat protein [Pseudomonas gingeri]